MSRVARELPKKEVPERIRRDLKKGETIFHSMMACHVSAKYPEGKFVGQVRREESSRLVKYPVKAFGTPKEALEYIKSLRPNAQGRVNSPRQGEPTVSDLFEFVSSHRQKKLSEKTKKDKRTRWRLYIQPAWGSFPISTVTTRAAQEWVSEVEEEIEEGRSDGLGLSQFEKVRTDLHALFGCLAAFSPDYEDRKNPFAGLDFTAPQPRVKITIESQHFGALTWACRRLAEEELATEWIVEMFLTGLLAGLREGEIMALCRDQLDFTNGAILVDRALRRTSRAIDPKNRLEVGPVLRQAVNYPKGGSATNRRTRVVPMSDQLAAVLRPIYDRSGVGGAEWDFLWPSESGKLKELTRFRTAWSTLRERLHELATLAPEKHEGTMWPKQPKRRGWQYNPLVREARARSCNRLPDQFGSIDFRDTRNSFASYMNEVAISEATREHTGTSWNNDYDGDLHRCDERGFSGCPKATNSRLDRSF
jgi:integrase